MGINFKASGSQKISGILKGTTFHELVGAPDGEPEAEHGSFILNDNGEYTYTPKLGFFGIDTLTFGNGQTMSILVGPPEGQGLKDVVEGINSIGTIISDFGSEYEPESSNLYNSKLEEVDDREFNHFTLENNGKWGLMGEAVDLDGDGNAWEYEYYDFRIQQLTNIANHVQDNLNSKINLHTVLWDQQGHQAQNIIERFNATNVDASAPTVQEVFEASVSNHLEVLLDALGNSVDLIDVVNEHLYSSHPDNGFGIYNQIYDDPTGYIKFAFAETQRAIDNYNRDRPENEQIDARLAINDFNVLYQIDDNKYDPDFDTPDVKADLYYDLVKGLIDDGVEIDVVGFQAHLSIDRINRHIGQNTDDDDLNNNVPATADEIYDAILDNLQRFIDLGVEIVISELDVRTHINSYDPDGEVDHEASNFSMVYEVIGALAHDIPEITDVTLWGTAHHVSWLSDVENDPSLFSGNSDDGYSREAEYYAFMEGLTGNSDYNRVDSGRPSTSNSAPIAVDDNGYTVAPNEKTIIDVLDNDRDPDGDDLTITHINGVEFFASGWTDYIVGVGLIELNADGTLTHHSLDVPEGDFSFSYTISDGQGGEAEAFVNGTISVPDSGETVHGTAGDDSIDGTDFADELYGYEGYDIFYGSSGDDLISGQSWDSNEYNQVNYLGEGVSSSDFTFTLQLEDGVESVVVTSEAFGQDTLYGIGGIYFEEDGWKSIEDLLGGSGLTIHGTVEDDSLDGTSFADILYGYGGDDVFYGSAGDDIIYGQSSDGDEYNQVNYLGEGVSSSDFTFTLSVEDGVKSVIATSEAFGQDTLYGIDGIYFEEDGWKSIEDLPGLSGVTLYGTEGDDSLDGTDFADTLYGYGGYDIFYGSSGNDTIYGQSAGGDEYNQVNYLGEGVSSSDFTFTLNVEDGVESVIATSEVFGQDTLYGIGGIYFEEDGWIAIEDLPGLSGIGRGDRLDGYDTIYCSTGNDRVYDQHQGESKDNQENHLGKGLSSDFVLTLNVEDAAETVIATSKKYGQDTFYGTDGIYFEEDGWQPIEDIYS